jgi:rhodanese-related sulfurtransferase
MSDLDRGGANADEITYSALVKALDAGEVALVDVREDHEYEAGHVAGATLNALSVFDPQALPRDKPVVLICRSGRRSLDALHLARAAGFTYIGHYKGGVLGWAQEGGTLV